VSPRPTAAHLLALALGLALGAARPAAAQPDWLPPEVRERRARQAAARALDPCADPLLRPMAPALRDTGFDRTASPCLTSEIAVSARGAALVDLPDVHDTLAGSLFVDLRLHPLPRLELTVGGRALDVRHAQNAGVDETEVAFGPAYLAAAAELDRRTLAGRPLHLAWAMRLDLPYTDSGHEVPVAAASPQVVAAWAVSPSLVGHARVAALLWLARPPDDVHTRRAAALSTDWAWAPAGALAIGLGAEAQTGWYGLGLDHLLVRGGLRVPLGCRARLDLTGAARLLGEDRTDALVQLGFARDL